MTLGTVRQLSNADRAIVEERRIRDYLLNREHADGGPKARFFIARGFTVDAGAVLQASLIIQRDEYSDQNRRYGMGTA